MASDLHFDDLALPANPVGYHPESPLQEDRLGGEPTESMAVKGEDLTGNSFQKLPAVTPSSSEEFPFSHGRSLVSGLAPAALLLPLVLVSLAILLLNPGWFQKRQPAVHIPPKAVVQPTVLPPTAEATIGGATPAPAFANLEELEGLLDKAQGLVWQSKFEDAIAIYQALAQEMPTDARPHIGWARALLLDDLPDQALTHAQLALTLDPAAAEASIVLAQVYASLGDKTRALPAAQSALGLDSRNAEAHAVLAQAYLLHGYLKEAVDEAKMALRQDRRSAEAHRVRGQLHKAVDGDLQGAIRELKLAAELQPLVWLRHYELGLVQLQAEDYDAALVALKEAWVLRRKLLTYGALGQAYYRLGQYDRAASYLEQSISVGAWNGDTYALLASINAQRGRCGDALYYANQAFAQDPNQPLALGAKLACQGASPASPAEPTAESGAKAQAGSLSSYPALSGRIAFAAWNVETSQYDTYVADIDGSQRALVIEGMHQPAFSPEGQWLSVNGERPDHLNLFIVRPDGSELREITEHVEDGFPSWSPTLPTGNKDFSLAFSSTRHGDKQPRIYVVDRMPLDGQKVDARLLSSGLDDVRGEFPTWAWYADQMHLVYAGCQYDEGGSAECGLMRIPSRPGSFTPRPLTTHPGDTAPAAHGSRIAFMSNRDGNWEIYLVESDGSGLKRLTHGLSNDGLPTWSPDGQAIAFLSDEGGAWAVWAVKPDGSQRQRLLAVGDLGPEAEWQRQRISWGPGSP